MHLLSRKKKHTPSNSPWSAHDPPFEQSPSPLFRSSHALSMSATATGELFFIGGYVYREGSKSIDNDLYRISTRNFSTTLLKTSGDAPSPRLGHCAVLAGSIFLIWGGVENYPDQVHDDSLYLLNLESQEWSKIVINGPKPSARYYHTITLVGSKLFVFGGRTFSRNFFNDIWALDLNCLQSNPFWESYEPAPGDEKPHPRSDHVSVASGDRIIIFGGYGGPYTWFNDIWSFNISTRKWTELRCTGSIPSPRAGHAAVLIHDRMYVFGGYQGDEIYLNDLTVFNLSTQRWTAFQDIGPSPSKRICHAMARDGTRVFVFGGSSSRGHKADGTKPIYVLETKLLNYPEPDVINSSEEAAQLVGKSSPRPPMRGQLHQPSSLSNAHAAHRASSFQKELDDPTFQYVTREQNAGLNNLPSRPTGASGGSRLVLEDSEDSTEHNAKPIAPSGGEMAWSENKRLIELEQQLSETVVAQTEQERRIGQLTELAQAAAEKRRPGKEQRELQMKLDKLQAKLDESLLSHDHALEQAEANAAEEKRNSALELRKLQTKLDESLLSRDQAEANTAGEKKRAELEKRELQVKLDELQAKLDESLLSRNHTVDQPEASAAEERRRAAPELRELQEKLDGLQLSRDKAEANAADAMKRAALEQRELQAKLGELLMSRDKHLRMLEQAQTALQKATSRTADADADERSQPACEHETELAELRAELERKKSELAAVRFRLTEAKDGWAKGKAKADKLHSTVTAASLIDLNEDRTVCDLTEDMQIMEAGLASLKWSEKSIEDMDCGNEG